MGTGVPHSWMTFHRGVRISTWLPVAVSVTLAGCLYPDRAQLDLKSPAYKYASCATPRGPDAKYVPSQNPDFDSAVNFASDTESLYKSFLTNREGLQVLPGIGLIGLAGASLGLTTTGASTEAATATGLASGTGLAAYGFIENKQKAAAYTGGLTQLQCVVNKAGVLQPLEGLTTGGIFTLADDLKASGNHLSRIPLPTASCDDATTDAFKTALTDGRLAEAQALAARDRADALRSAFDAAPVSIINGVCSIDSAAFVTSQGGINDSAALTTAIGKVGPQPKPSGSSTSTSGSSTTKQTNALVALDFLTQHHRAAAPKPIKCSGQTGALVEATQDLKDKTRALNVALSGVNWTPQGFADCLKTQTPAGGKSSTSPASGTPAASSTASPAGGAGASPSDTSAKLQVSLSTLGWQTLDQDGALGTVIVTGGLPPYRWYVVDPGLSVVQVAEDASSLVLNLEADSNDGIFRALIADYAGNEITITVNP